MLAEQGERTQKAFQRGTVYELRGWRRWTFEGLWLLFRLYRATLRYEISAEELALLTYHETPVLIIVWHNRSVLLPEMGRRYREPGSVSGLISPSKHAAWEVALYRKWGVRVVRGSSNRRSIQAVREMVAESRQGYDLGISPDGPSGPLYSFSRGALALARMTRARLLFICPNTRWCLRLPTWDRHLVPLPGARLKLRCHLSPPYQEIPGESEEAKVAWLRGQYAPLTDDPFPFSWVETVTPAQKT